jgi:hypothetical protein
LVGLGERPGPAPPTTAVSDRRTPSISPPPHKNVECARCPSCLSEPDPRKGPFSSPQGHPLSGRGQGQLSQREDEPRGVRLAGRSQRGRVHATWEGKVVRVLLKDCNRRRIIVGTDEPDKSGPHDRRRDMHVRLGVTRRRLRRRAPLRKLAGHRPADWVPHRLPIGLHRVWLGRGARGSGLL